MNAFKRALLVWMVLLAALSLANWHDGGLNASSRFAAIQALVEDHSFRIDPYRAWTEDWARAPDGHIYSNKAPAPMFLAAPFAWLFDRVKVAAHRPLTEPGIVYKTAISVLLQVIPYCLLTLAAVGWLKRQGASYAALNFAVVALLFGNTLSLFLNLYVGHPIAGWALLAMFLCLTRRNYLGAGALFGLAALSDYGTIFIALPFAISALMLESETSRARRLGAIALGGLVPALIWIWYHTECFGTPWALPMQFQNPRFVESAAEQTRLWGIATPIPDWRVFLKLCFGAQRGILFTQPWMWVLVFAIVSLGLQGKFNRELKAWLVLSFGGLFGLLWMNAGFNGWMAGASAGPRYLSIIFPCIAVLAGLLYDRLPQPTRALLWATLAYSVFFRIVAFATTPLTETEDGLWSYFLYYFTERPHPLFRLAIFASALAPFIGASLYLRISKPA
jgi:hypothetical protein